MLDRMRDPLEDPKIRAQMAVAAAPYCHPRIASVELTGKNGGPIQQQIVALLVDGTEATSEEVCPLLMDAATHPPRPSIPPVWNIDQRKRTRDRVP